MKRVPILIALLVMAGSAWGEGHRLLVADYSTKRIAIIDPAGKIEWEYKIDDLHDLHLLPTGGTEKGISTILFGPSIALMCAGRIERARR